MISDQRELKVRIGVMENLMDENKDDNLDQWWKNWKKEKQNLKGKAMGDRIFWFKKQEES